MGTTSRRGTLPSVSWPSWLYSATYRSVHHLRDIPNYMGVSKKQTVVSYSGAPDTLTDTAITGRREFVCLFHSSTTFCQLYNFMLSNERMNVNHELEWREWSLLWPAFKALPRHFAGENKGNHEEMTSWPTSKPGFLSTNRFLTTGRLPHSLDTFRIVLSWFRVFTAFDTVLNIFVFSYNCRFECLYFSVRFQTLVR